MKEKIFLFIILFGFSCSVNKQATHLKSTYVIPEEYKAFSSQLKGNTILLTHLNSPTPKMPEKFLELVLIDTLSNEIFFKDQLREGIITWIDDNIFKVSYTPGNPHMGTEYFYYYNIEKRQKINQSIIHEFK